MGIQDHIRNIPIKRRDMGITGAIIVLSQLLSSFQSSENVSKEIEKVRDDFQQSIVDRETFFVRKTDIFSMLEKLDKMNSQLIRLNEQMRSIKDTYAFLKKDEEQLVGCRYNPNKKNQWSVLEHGL